MQILSVVDKLQGPLRQIFVEFLERSFTAEFSGFLLYKEVGRRLKVGFFFFFLGLKSILYIPPFSDFVGFFFCYVENKPSGG